MAITDANGATISPNGGWRILANSTARKTINLGTAPDAGVVWTITDTVGDAGSNNITINATGGQTIGGSASLTINTNNGRVSLKSTGSGWTVLSNSVDANPGGGGSGKRRGEPARAGAGRRRSQQGEQDEEQGAQDRRARRRTQGRGRS